MFKFDESRGHWVAYGYVGTYTEVRTIYGDAPEEFPADTTLTPIILTEAQEKRLEAVNGDRSIYLDDLIGFVMEGQEVAGSEKYLKTMALESLIDDLPDAIVESNLDSIKELAKAWKAGENYKKDQRLSHNGKLYRVRQAHTSQEHQPPDAEGMGAIYFPYVPPNQVVDYDPGRNLAEFPYQVGELIRFPYGVYECLRITNFSPQEYAPDWLKRDDLQ